MTIVQSIVAPISQETRTYSACAAPGEIVFERFRAKLILGGVKRNVCSLEHTLAGCSEGVGWVNQRRGVGLSKVYLFREFGECTKALGVVVESMI